MAITNNFIVEGPNDKAYLELLLTEIDQKDNAETIMTDPRTEILDLHKFTDPDDSSKELRGKTVIGKRLTLLNRDLSRNYKDVKHIGIILDADDMTIPDNLELVNNAVLKSFGTNPNFTKEGEPRVIEQIVGRNKFPFKFSCFFTKDATAQGNLESLLFEIRLNPEIYVPYADCLHHWKDCVKESDSLLKVKDSDFQKMWMDNFFRAKIYELFPPKERKRILNDYNDKKHTLIANHGKALFDLAHPTVQPLRAYLAGCF